MYQIKTKQRQIPEKLMPLGWIDSNIQSADFMLNYSKSPKFNAQTFWLSRTKKILETRYACRGYDSSNVVLYMDANYYL